MIFVCKQLITAGHMRPLYGHVPCYSWCGSMSYVIGSNNSYKPITNTAWRGFVPGFANYKKGCTRLATASDKVYQLLAHGRWFSPGTPASSTTKTGRHDLAEILLKVALKHQKSKSSHDN